MFIIQQTVADPKQKRPDTEKFFHTKARNSRFVQPSKREDTMKQLITLILLLVGLSSVASAQYVTDTLGARKMPSANRIGVRYDSVVAGGSYGVWSGKSPTIQLSLKPAETGPDTIYFEQLSITKNVLNPLLNDTTWKKIPYRNLATSHTGAAPDTTGLIIWANPGWNPIVKLETGEATIQFRTRYGTTLSKAPSTIWIRMWGVSAYASWPRPTNFGWQYD